MSARERFWGFVNTDGPLGCWLWTGSQSDNGYGSFTDDGRRTVSAHRFSFEMHVGPIPDDLVIDHLCRVHHCVNPDHLEAVTIRVNTLRGIGPTAINARKMHCVNGHEFTPENTYIAPGRGSRHCRTCFANNNRRNRSVKKTFTCEVCGKELERTGRAKHMRRMHQEAA